MKDRDIMENLLFTTKSALDLYMHGAVESGTQNVHTAFSRAFNETMAIQDCLYKEMENHGWYKTEQADANKINQLRQKYSAQG